MSFVPSLAALIKPPLSPRRPVGELLHRSLSGNHEIELPIDYIELLEIYGAGAFANDRFQFHLFDLTTPVLMGYECRFNENDSSNFAVQPIDEFPMSPKMLPWGADDQGETFYWIVDTTQEKWQTTVSSNQHHAYDMGVAELLWFCFKENIPFYGGEKFGPGIKFYPAKS